MGTRTEHAPGTFSWADLTTSDSEGAKSFYGELFGWEFEDNEIPGDGGVYTMAKVGREHVAAIPPATEDFPPHWNSYVTVSSADETAAKAKELGANMIEEPFDVMEAGRMALFQDPTGAVLCVWEARDAIGAGRVNEPGCLTWNELHTPDPDKALEFYSGLFGWSSQEMDTGEGNSRYIVVRNGDRSNGGLMDAQQGEPPNWLPYFVVEKRDDAIAKVKELGGRDLFQMDMPQGKIAVFTDPQGAAFAVWEGDVDD
jgi:predicted enzyme related to lactoylglutathione lyase